MRRIEYPEKYVKRMKREMETASRDYEFYGNKHLLENAIREYYRLLEGMSRCRR